MMEKPANSLVADIRSSIVLLGLSEIRPRYFAFITALALLVALLSTYSVGLLLPLVHGMINGSFDHVKTLPIFRFVAPHIPTLFATQASTFFTLVVALYVVTLLKNSLQYYAMLHAQVQARQATVVLRNKLFTTCMYIGKHFYDENKISLIHHMFIRIPILLEAQFRVFQRFVVQIILVSVYFMIMFFISWRLTLIVAIVFPVVALITNQIIVRIRVASKKTENASADMSGQLLNLLLCLPIVKGFSKETYEIDRFAAANEQEVSNTFYSKKLINLIGPIEDVGTTTAALLVAVGMTFLLHTSTVPSVSLLFIFFFLALQVLRSVGIFNTLRINIAGAEPVVEQIQALFTARAVDEIPSGEIEMPSLTTGIEFKNVSFAYPNKKEQVLRDVSFTIPKGKTIALVGPTGSGKSTITNMLLRLYDCPPKTIFIDGVDIRLFSLASVRNRISFVYQDSLLFNTTIRENTLYGTDGAVSDDAVETMMTKLCLTDVVADMKDGLETAVGDNSTRVSGGQKRLLSLVRALLREHEILIMDEATNSLDARTEQMVLDTVMEQSKEKTVLLVSHRLSTIKHADHIVYLDHGRIVEQGTYDELVEQQGVFYKQWLTK